ncbi:MAG TPA: hypothetical protein DHW40_09540 [Microbacterium sp.]|nr:hypothetical protein [Microbacterium sp.]
MTYNSAGVFEVLIKDGTHLADSAISVGDKAAVLLKDATNVVDGAAILRKIDPEKLVEDVADRIEVGKTDGVDSKLALGITLGVVIGIAVAATAVVVYNKRSTLKAWWMDRVIPTVATRLRLSSRRHDDAAPEVEQVPVTAITVESFSTEIAEAVGDMRATMSSEEARGRFITMLLAAAVVADELRTLQSHRIVDDEDRAGLEAAMSQLTTEEVAALANRALEPGEFELDESKRQALIALLGGGAPIDGVYVPVTRERIAKALLLPEVAGDDSATPAAE